MKMMIQFKKERSPKVGFEMFLGWGGFLDGSFLFGVGVFFSMPKDGKLI